MKMKHQHFIRTKVSTPPVLRLISICGVQVPLSPKTFKLLWKIPNQCWWCWEKNTHSESWNADGFGAMRTFLSNPPLWGTDLWTSRFIKSAQVHPVVCTSWEWLGIGAGVHATLLRLHRNKYCMEQLTSPRRKLSDITPQHHGNMYADDSWIQIEARPDIQKPPLKFSGRESGWTTHTQTQTDNWTDTHTYLSSFWAVFQCAISSAERPQSCLWKLAFMTAWSVPYSNYRWQHTRTQTYMHKHTHMEEVDCAHKTKYRQLTSHSDVLILSNTQPCKLLRLGLYGNTLLKSKDFWFDSGGTFLLPSNSASL